MVFDNKFEPYFICVPPVLNQMKLCDDKLFSFLAELLKPHPLATPTQSASPALMASVAYVCGCLMSGNYQGQNMAREKRLLHRLIALFKYVSIIIVC